MPLFVRGISFTTIILLGTCLGDAFFFICNLDVASKRRYKELKKHNPYLKLKDVKKALRIRNISDIKRKNSPLLKHRDSIEIDTGKLNKQAMMKKLSKHVEKALVNKKYGI